MKGLPGMVFLALTLCAGGAAAQDLPRPPGLDGAVQFWKRVYTEIDSDQALLHDARQLERVYARIALPPNSERRASQRRIGEVKSLYTDVLLRLASQGGRPETAIEQRVRALFPVHILPSQLRAAAERLRVQRGVADRFREGLVRSGQWIDYIRDQLRENDVPTALAALPHVESSFNPGAASHAGAVGLWQFTAGTGRDFMRIDGVVDQRLDPWRASRAAAELLARNYAQLGDWGLAVTAYNHGANGMRRAVRALGTRSIAAIIDRYDGPYFGFASRNFYPALLAAAEVDANASQYFPGVRRESSSGAPVRVAVPDYMTAAAAADALGTTPRALRALNRDLRAPVWDGRKFVPKGYRLRVPGQSAAQARERLAAVSPGQRYTRQRPDVLHVVRSGDTLSGIAARYDVAVGALAAANGRARSAIIRVGERLRLPLAGRAPRSLAEVSVAKGGTLYTVSSGDTLYGIAARFGISLSTLVRINDLDDPDRLRVGQSLQVVTPDAMASGVAMADEG